MYLHKTEDGKYLISSFKNYKNMVPVKASDLYKQHVHLSAPWLIDHSKSYLRLILERSNKKVLKKNTVPIYIMQNDVLTRQIKNIPKENIIFIGSNAATTNDNQKKSLFSSALNRYNT